MMRTIDLRGWAGLTRAELAEALPRAELNVEAAVVQVRPLLEDIARRGRVALEEQAARFGGVVPPSPRGHAELATA
ncbi:MAG: histidinol dehydrogenase, partial [Bifidobacteriaceae bacterium]|nr:histidinol dehydrogenase [Bifidobacteriaceae bacterium]